MHKTNNKYDAILYLDDKYILEYDDRSFTSPNAAPQITRGKQVSINYDDPKFYSSFSFGVALRNSLDGLGSGYSHKITDFGKWVVAEITYHNRITGRSASKTFLIVFKHKGDGIVLSTHNRYRTISGVEQAASYIRSASSSLPSSTQTKIG